MDKFPSKIEKLMENIMSEEDILISYPHATSEWLAVFARDGNILGYSVITDSQDIEFFERSNLLP